MIVIVANELDSHSDFVIITLKELGFTDVLRIDLETAHNRFDVSVTTDDNSRPTALITNKAAPDKKYSSNQLKTIWWRRATNYLNPGFLNLPSLSQLDQVQTYWALRWFLEAVPESSYPFGHPSLIRAAENKMRQLTIAGDLGFRIPSTLFSNNPCAIREFCLKHPELVVKPLHTSVVLPDEDSPLPGGVPSLSLIARPVKSDHLIERLSEIERTSLFCQERIPKVADIRLNVLHDHIIACRIDNSKLERSEVDWRPSTYEHDHVIIDTPIQIEEKCRAFLSYQQLSWGAFDFGLTESGEWIFFECNPNGQWLWIEMKTGSPLSMHFARHLLAHHEGLGGQS